jgi:hypothetical protein
VFSKSSAQGVLFSLAPGFSPVTPLLPVMLAAASGMVKKPLKRLAGVRRANTGLKPGANERQLAWRTQNDLATVTI